VPLSHFSLLPLAHLLWLESFAPSKGTVFPVICHSLPCSIKLFAYVCHPSECPANSHVLSMSSPATHSLAVFSCAPNAPLKFPYPVPVWSPTARTPISSPPYSDLCPNVVSAHFCGYYGLLMFCGLMLESLLCLALLLPHQLSTCTHGNADTCALSLRHSLACSQ